MKTKQELQKDAQDFLRQAEECLAKAAECAEAGGFTISFHEGGIYVPAAAFAENPELREKARKAAEEDNKEVWAEMSVEAREQYADDYYEDYRHELIPYEYCDEPGWWMPSRNC